VTTTRIHDLAAEFGISSEQLIGMLKELDIFVRSHLSPLKPEQVALMRARWEREKRKLKEAPAPPKRRRAVKAAEPVAAAPEERPKRRRRTAAEMAAVEAEAQAVPALAAYGRPRALSAPWPAPVEPDGRTVVRPKRSARSSTPDWRNCANRHTPT